MVGDQENSVTALPEGSLKPQTEIEARALRSGQINLEGIPNLTFYPSVEVVDVNVLSGCPEVQIDWNRAFSSGFVEHLTKEGGFA